MRNSHTYLCTKQDMLRHLGNFCIRWPCWWYNLPSVVEIGGHTLDEVLPHEPTTHASVYPVSETVKTIWQNIVSDSRMFFQHLRLHVFVGMAEEDERRWTRKKSKHYDQQSACMWLEIPWTLLLVVAIALMKHVCLFVYSQLLDLSRKDKPKARVLKLNNQVAVSLFEVVNKFKWS